MCSNLEFLGLYFTTFGLDMESCRANIPIQSQYGKIQLRKTLNKDTICAEKFRYMSVNLIN